jgi:hypothetical protein
MLTAIVSFNFTKNLLNIFLILLECECVSCETLTLNYTFPNPPPNWGKKKPHWNCSGGRQFRWEEHERNRRCIMDAFGGLGRGARCKNSQELMQSLGI